MALHDDLKTEKNHWAEIEAAIQAERRSTSLELRWRQLNSAFIMAKRLGLIRSDSSEAEVFE